MRAISSEIRQLFDVEPGQFVTGYNSINRVRNGTLRARARAAVDIAHLKLAQSTNVEVDKVDHNGNLQTP